MADDFPNNASTTGRLPIGGTIGGSLETVNDSDWFAVTLLAGYNYQIGLSATPGFANPTNLQESLLDSNGARLAGGTLVKNLTYTPTVSATDYIAVSSNSGNGVGNYVLTSSPADDLPSNTNTTLTLSAGSSRSGTLEGLNDSDWIAVPVRGGYNTQITLNAGTGTANPTDLQEVLVDVNGTRVAGGTLVKSFNFVPTADGVDYLVVSSNSGDSIGTYTVAETPADDYVATSATSGRLAVGGTINAKLEGVGDSDWFAVTLTAGSSYQFGLAATPGFLNPSDLQLSLVNVNGARVAGGTLIKTTSFTPTVSGTYYLAVSSNSGDGIGTYTLSSPTVTAPTPSVPVYRFFDTRNGTQFLTASASERDTVISTRPDLSNEGIGLNAALSTDPNASAVYRFFDTVYGTHFFTSSSNERDTILATRADLTYEGIGFYEYANQQSGSSAVYRFFDTHAGTHFYTGSATERATILATRPDLTPEGTAFYAPT